MQQITRQLIQTASLEASLVNNRNNNLFYLIALTAIGLLAYAYTSHLTFLKIDPRLDEIRRGLVSLEMMLSGNYWVPTINGEPYLNKPPLYNWLLVLSYKIFGINEFALRIPVIAAIFFYGWVIFHFAAKYIHRQTALLAALLFMSNGRILIYDSLMGLIDILYSSLVFLSFMLIYHLGQQKRWFALFAWSYVLVVAGYLMKGLPSIVYQGFALLVYFGITKQWKILFHRAHFVGIGIMAGLLGLYYAIYFSKVNLPPATLFTRIVTESTMRTYREDTNWWQDFALHFTTYPLVFGYHYAPWTILLLLVIRKKWLSFLRANHFIWFCAILFFACIFIYWLSPYIIARYLFMLLPLCFLVAAFYYDWVSKPVEKLRLFIEYLLVGVLVIAGTGIWVLPFIEVTSNLPGVVWKTLITSALLLACAFAATRMPAYRLAFIVLGIVASRLGFNWFVVVQRGEFSIQQQQEAEMVMQKAGNRPIYLQNGADHGNPDGLSFNIALKQKRILPLTDSIYAGAVYVTDSATMVQRPHTVLYKWGSEFQPNHYLVTYP